jgi:hypothetical protein
MSSETLKTPNPLLRLALLKDGQRFSLGSLLMVVIIHHKLST